MALIENNTLSFMFEGVRRGDEDKLKALLNENGEVTLKLLRNESPNLFRSIFHFELKKKYIPKEATPEEPPADWEANEVPELIVEKAVSDAEEVKASKPLKEALAKETVKLDIIEHFNDEIPELPIKDSDPLPQEDSADDLLIVEGDELTGETEAAKFPEKEEIPVEKVDDTPKVKSPKAKKAK